MAISEELELDITGALEAIESLTEPLSALGENLTISLNTAIESVTIEPLVEQLAALDASGLTTTIDTAVDAVDGTVPVDADTAAIPGEVDAAIDTAEGVVSVDADASAVPLEIDTAISEADPTVTLDADTSDFGGSIDEALAAADAAVTVDADASGIGEEIAAEIDSADTTVVIEADGSALADLGEDANAATSGLDNAAGSFTGLAGAGGAVLGGDIVGGISGALGKAGPAGAAAAAGIGVFTAGLSTFVTAGTDAVAAQQRFNSTLGKFADDARTINVGSLNTSLEDLAIRLGSDDEKALQATATLFQFAKAAGLSGKQAAGFANNVQALAARAVALNPALGDTGDVAVALQNALARGQRATAKFNIALGTNEIVQRALSNTGKKAAQDLSAQEKSFAGAQIAAEKYGKGLEKDINKGSKNAALQQRSFNEQIQDFIEEAGKPLVAPFFDLLKQLVPVAKALIPTFGVFAEAVLPVLVQILKDNIPTIKLFGELLKVLAPIMTPLIRASLLMLTPISGLSKAFKGLGGSLEGIGAPFEDLGKTIGDIGGTIIGFFTDLGDVGDAVPDFSGILEFFTDLPGTITGALGDATSALTGFAAGGATELLNFFTGLPGQIGSALAALPGFIRDVFVQTMTDAAAAVIAGGLSVVAAVAILPGKIVEALRTAVGALITVGTELIQGLINGVTVAVPAVLNFFVQLPGRIIESIGNTLTTLVAAGTNLIQGLINGVQSIFPVVVRFFQELPGSIVGFIGDVLGTLRQQGTDIIQGFIDGAVTAGQGVIRFFQGLPGAAAGAVGNVLRGAGSLFEKGLQIIQGLIDGIVQKAKAIPKIIKDKVLDLIPKGVKDFFDLGSPSKLMAGFGRDITAGLALGITDEAGKVESAVAKLSKDAIAGVSTIPAALPIPGISRLPAVAAALPSAAAAATTVGPPGVAGTGAINAATPININVTTTSPNPVDVGLEMVRQLQAQAFRTGR